MLDSKYLRQDINQTAERLAQRGFKLDVDTINALEESRKALQVKTQELQSERNTRSKSIGQAKSRGEDIKPLLESVGQLGAELDAVKAEQDEVLEKLKEIALSLPNLHDESVPQGKDEDENVEILKWGEPKAYDFEVKIMLI